MRMRNIGRWLAGALCTGLLCQMLALPALAGTAPAAALAGGTAQTVQELEAENGWSLEDLRAQYPEGRYWNHADTPGAENNDPLHTSSIPCWGHSGPLRLNYDTCNHTEFENAYCCDGYAEQLGYLYSGISPRQWEEVAGDGAAIDRVGVGDIIRFTFDTGAEHSVFVTAVSGDCIYYTDCNQDGKCGISWSRNKTKSYLRSRVNYVRFCPGNHPTGDPLGAVESIRGEYAGVTVKGWAFDWDDPYAALQIQVYLDDTLVCQTPADQQRDDLKDTYSGIGSRHGFCVTVPTTSYGEHRVTVYAVNVGNGADKALAAQTVTVYRDDRYPDLQEWAYDNVTTEGFDVGCCATDNIGVDHVEIAVWKKAEDKVCKIAQERETNRYYAHFDVSELGGQHGVYKVLFCVYDAAGNYTYNTQPMEVNVPYPELGDPTITFDACGGTAEFAEKQLQRNADGMHYGALPEAWMDGYVFDGWYTAAAGGTRVSRSTVYAAEGSTTLYAHWTPVAANAAQGWSLQDGTLVIAAQGAMQDYASAAQTPWFKDRAEIRRIVVQQGVTSLGDYAFYGCENVASVTLPDTVTRIGRLAFYGCKSLRTLTVPASVTVVEDYAFAGAAGLQSIAFGGDAPALGVGIFADVDAEVQYPAAAAGWTETVRQGYTGSVRWSAVAAAAPAAQSDLQLEDPVLESLLAESCV